MNEPLPVVLAVPLLVLFWPTVLLIAEPAVAVEAALIPAPPALVSPLPVT